MIFTSDVLIHFFTRGALTRSFLIRQISSGSKGGGGSSLNSVHLSFPSKAA
ncbi:hypothetical protein LDVICp140 [lymphocystis disease virus-China]|uniref:Uncharacterized protein n=1 Tax=lymphocystis disease virus-China TaxID=256729 RepID=Q677X2_9VIRU|nr:hypothetical protein LDVICp140 [lymphocystis disease virus-China]AAU10985.1 hypothetical protein [lymphocystis disease virus-China]